MIVSTSFAYNHYYQFLGLAVACGFGYHKIVKFIQYYKDVRQKCREGWTHIGKIESIYIYPIDGGQALKVNKGVIDNNGIRTYGKDPFKIIHDRQFVIYENQEPYHALVKHPGLSRLSNPVVQNVWRRLPPLAITHRNPGNHHRNINYLSYSMPIVSFGNIHDSLESVFGFSQSVQGGMILPSERKNFNVTVKQNQRINTFQSNFSMFTLVNQSSVRDLKCQTDSLNLSHKNFRPHFVISGKKKYVEEGICALKIKDLEFCNVIPCVHTQDINFNFKSSDAEAWSLREDAVQYASQQRLHEHDAEAGHSSRTHTSAPQTEPTEQTYRFLRNTHSFRDKYQQFFPVEDNPLEPVFGINFDCPDIPEINYTVETDHAVFAKYHPNFVAGDSRYD